MYITIEFVGVSVLTDLQKNSPPQILVDKRTMPETLQDFVQAFIKSNCADLSRQDLIRKLIQDFGLEPGGVYVITPSFCLLKTPEALEYNDAKVLIVQ